MEESPFKGKTGVQRVLNAFVYSVHGLDSAFRHEEAFRQEVKALELAAERLLMETLAGLADQGHGASTLEALSAAADAWGEAPPAQTLADLARVLG